MAAGDVSQAGSLVGKSVCTGLTVIGNTPAIRLVLDAGAGCNPYGRAAQIRYPIREPSYNLTRIGDSPQIGMAALRAVVRWLGSRDDRTSPLPSLGHIAGGTSEGPGARARPDGDAPNPQHPNSPANDHRGDGR